MCIIINACKLSPFSHVQLFATLGTVAHETPLFMGFSRQEYWSGLPSSRDLPNPGTRSICSPALAGGFFTTCATWEGTLIIWNKRKEPTSSLLIIYFF